MLSFLPFFLLFLPASAASNFVFSPYKAILPLPNHTLSDYVATPSQLITVGHRVLQLSTTSLNRPFLAVLSPKSAQLLLSDSSFRSFHHSTFSLLTVPPRSNVVRVLLKNQHSFQLTTFPRTFATSAFQNPLHTFPFRPALPHPSATFLESHILSSHNYTYICGTISHRTDTALKQYMQLYALATDGRVAWHYSAPHRAGKHTYETECSSMVLSSNNTRLYVAGVKRKTSKVSVVLYKFHALPMPHSQVVWTKSLYNTATMSLYPTDIIAAEDAVFVSATLFNQPSAMYMFKLSDVRGTLLWSKELCCSAILKNIPGNHHLKGAATSNKALFQGTDRYIYQTGFYSYVKHGIAYTAGIMARIDPYGDFDINQDLSKPFAVLPAAQQHSQTAFRGANLTDALYIAATDVQWKDGRSEQYPSVQKLRIRPTDTKIQDFKTGPFDVILTFKVNITTSNEKSLSPRQLGDLLIERLRISQAQLNYTEITTNATAKQVTYMIELRHERAPPQFGIVRETLTTMFTGRFKNGQSIVEILFNLSSASVQFHEGSLRILRNVTVVSKAQTTTGSGSKWKIIVGVSAGIVGMSFVFIIGSLYWSHRRR